MDLRGKNVILTGASMGIGEAIAESLSREGANVALLSRSEASHKWNHATGSRCMYRTADVGDYASIDKAIESIVDEFGAIDVLINNAGLALGAPAAFPDLNISDILTMNSTNVNGMMLATYSTLNRAMKKVPGGEGTILNITSVTALEVPPFAGESVYHANKAAQEAFTNALRNELVGTNIRVLTLRPGCVATNFHSLRVNHDKEKYDKFFEGYTPLESKDIADAAIYMLKQPLHISVKAMDVVPTAHNPTSLIGLPRELRNEIFWLAVQDDIDPAREAELTSRPNPTIRALTQVSRSLSFHSGGLNIQLTKHARPSINAWTGNGFGAEETMKVIATAVLFPDICSATAPERSEKACEVLYEVGLIISKTEGYFLENGCVGRAERMEQNRAEVAELLNVQRLISQHELNRPKERLTCTFDPYN
ncbi:hypothetical protein MBLNU13_g10124t1 [Cladosporium sp. NU13]